MDEKTNCPFCGNIVNTNAYRCPSCGSLFAEPELPNICFREFGSFVALLVLTFGLFGIIWILLNVNAINKLVVNKADGIKLNTLITISIIDIGAYIFCLSNIAAANFIPLLTVAQCLIFIAITYRTLKIIQKYTKNCYDVVVEYNPYYIIFFNILYLIHFIDTYENRVMQIHEHFNPKSPQIIIFIILIFIIQFVLCWNTNVHQFYKWLFGM